MTVGWGRAPEGQADPAVWKPEDNGYGERGRTRSPDCYSKMPKENIDIVSDQVTFL